MKLGWAAAAGAVFPVAVIEKGGDRRSEVIDLGEVSYVEVVPPFRRNHHLPPRLPEHRHYEAVDSHWRLRRLVGHHLIPCMHILYTYILLYYIIQYYISTVNNTVVLYYSLYIFHRTKSNAPNKWDEGSIKYRNGCNTVGRRK